MSLLDNAPVPAIDFFVEYLTRGEYGKELTSRTENAAVFTCPGCGHSVEVRTTGLVAPDRFGEVADGTVLRLNLAPVPEFDITFQAAERAWQWLNS